MTEPAGTASVSDDRAAAEAVARLYATDVAAQAFGMRVVTAARGRAAVAMTVLPTMANGHGICHGGMIFTLADTAFAYACNSNGGAHLAAHASIEFLAPARVGDLLTAEANEHWHGGRAGLTDVRVVDASGRLIAVFRGRSQELRPAAAS
jgi:acyl-CoA thioesterase